MPYCKGDEANICEECGALVADGYQIVHNGQHVHAYSPDLHSERNGCTMCRLFEADAVHAVAPAPGTTAHARLLQQQADDESALLAWRHDCGHLIQGFWTAGAYCSGCGMDADDADDVTAHYRLVPVEGLTGEEQA